MKYFNKTILAVAITAASSQAMAAGFQLNSQSATGIGRAFAGDAVIADNASVLARNPAAMAMFDEKALSLGITYADVGVEVTDAKWGVPVTPSHSIPVNDYDHIDNAAEAKIIPNAFYIQPINDTFAFGLGVFSNYGTGTDTSDLALGGKIVPADLVGKTEVTTVNFNASISARINEQWSVGVGLDIIHGEGVLTRKGNILLDPSQTLNTVDVEADGIGFGGIVGVTYELDANNRFGLSYRFSPDMKVEGTLKKLSTKTFQMADHEELTVPMADIAQFAGFHQLTEQFALSYTAQWTQWSNFESVDLHGPDEPLKVYKWKDSWFFSVGGTYTLNDQWTLRAGYAYDQGVVDDIQSISIPDSDRQWVSIGATYHLTPKSSVDFGFAHVMGEETQVHEESLDGMNGVLSAVTNTGANYISLQYSYSF